MVLLSVQSPPSCPWYCHLRRAPGSKKLWETILLQLGLKLPGGGKKLSSNFDIWSRLGQGECIKTLTGQLQNPEYRHYIAYIGNYFSNHKDITNTQTLKKVKTETLSNILVPSWWEFLWYLCSQESWKFKNCIVSAETCEPSMEICKYGFHVDL